jgi:hypothetical protein
MLKTLKTGVASALIGVVALAGAANATTLVLAPNYSANLIWNNDGTVSLVSSPFVYYDAVQQQSEVWSNFSAGSSLAAGSTVTLAFAHVLGADHHTISFLAPFGATPATYSWGYTVTDIAANSYQSSLHSGLLQTVGTTDVVKSAVSNLGFTYDTIFTQVGPTVASGNTSVSFPVGTFSLNVTESLTVSGLTGSDVTGISNSIVENAIPEASTWVMMLAGFGALGFAGYRRNKAASVAA